MRGEERRVFVCLAAPIVYDGRMLGDLPIGGCCSLRPAVVVRQLRAPARCRTATRPIEPAPAASTGTGSISATAVDQNRRVSMLSARASSAFGVSVTAIIAIVRAVTAPNVIVRPPSSANDEATQA
jgi:hypothetical protein